MTQRELNKAKKKKIEEIILAPFQTVFPYKDYCIRWEVATKKKVAIRIKNQFDVRFFDIDNISLSTDDLIYLPIDFDFKNKDKIKIVHKVIQEYLKKHYTLLECWGNIIQLNRKSSNPTFLKELKTHLELWKDIEDKSMERLYTDTTDEPTPAKQDEN